MNAEYIKSFIESAQSVIKMLLDIEAEPGDMYEKVSTFPVEQIIVMIGVTGRIKGQVCFELSEEIAKKIASSMMGGMPITELDYISMSAVSEMGNMIMGNASMILANKAIHIDITPPSLLTGENIEMLGKVPTIIAPLKLQGLGIINLNITVEEVI